VTRQPGGAELRCHSSRGGLHGNWSPSGRRGACRWAGEPGHEATSLGIAGAAGPTERSRRWRDAPRRDVPRLSLRRQSPGWWDIDVPRSRPRCEPSGWLRSAASPSAGRAADRDRGGSFGLARPRWIWLWPGRSWNGSSRRAPVSTRLTSPTSRWPSCRPGSPNGTGVPPADRTPIYAACWCCNDSSYSLGDM